MHVSGSTDQMLLAALQTVRQSDGLVPPALDRFPHPVYVTDARGLLTHHNRACVNFAGRTPRVGHDVWCVTWKLRTVDGVFLPHDQCPMALAIQEKRAIRGVEAVAERPNGTYVYFRPYPTPLYDKNGAFVGAVNLLLDVTGRATAETLRTRADRYSLLVNLMPDLHGTNSLQDLVADCNNKACRIEHDNPLEAVIDGG
jgi:PAS domain-containing protein